MPVTPKNTSHSPPIRKWQTPPPRLRSPKTPMAPEPKRQTGGKADLKCSLEHISRTRLFQTQIRDRLIQAERTRNALPDEYAPSALPGEHAPIALPWRPKKQFVEEVENKSQEVLRDPDRGDAGTADYSSYKMEEQLLGAFASAGRLEKAVWDDAKL